MKHIMQILLVGIVLLFIFTSCNKDQRCVNWLEGEWRVIGAILTDSMGVETDRVAVATAFGGSFNGTFSFDSYTVKDEEIGTARLVLNTTLFGGTDTEVNNYDYEIRDRCSVLWLRDQNSGDEDEAEIDASGKSEFVIIINNSSDKSSQRLTIQKD